MVDDDKPSLKKEIFWYSSLLVAIFLIGLYWKSTITVSNFFEAFGPILPRLAVAIITLFFANLFIRLTLPIVKKATITHFKTEEWRVIQKTYIYAIWLIALLVVISGIFGNLSSLGLSLSLIGAGIAFALQHVILSFAGWFLIMIKRPYRIGDRIYVKGKDILGDVEDITMFFTVLKEVNQNEAVTGKNVIIPNSTVFLEPIENYSFDTPHIWIAIPVSVTYESDLGLAEKILFNVAKEVAGQEMKKGAEWIKKKTPDSVQVETAREEPVIRVEFGESSVNIRARILCLPKQIPLFKSEIFRRVFIEFNKAENKDKVEIAYPHMELVFHDEVMSDRVKKYFEK